MIGQYATDIKSNEITAIPALLKLLDIDGAIVSIDAMGCQKNIASVIREQGADYFLGLKGNHPTRHREVLDAFNDEACAKLEHFNKTFDQEANRAMPARRFKGSGCNTT